MTTERAPLRTRTWPVGLPILVTMTGWLAAAIAVPASAGASDATVLSAAMAAVVVGLSGALAVRRWRRTLIWYALTPLFVVDILIVPAADGADQAPVGVLSGIATLVILAMTALVPLARWMAVLLPFVLVSAGRLFDTCLKMIWAVFVDTTRYAREDWLHQPYPLTTVLLGLAVLAASGALSRTVWVAGQDWGEPDQPASGAWTRAAAGAVAFGLPVAVLDVPVVAGLLGAPWPTVPVLCLAIGAAAVAFAALRPFSVARTVGWTVLGVVVFAGGLAGYLGHSN
jgi:hypothetical protein